MKSIFTLIIALLTLSSALAQTDVENSKDYPLFPRLEGYFIYQYLEKEFDSHEFYFEQKKHVKEGKKFAIYYRSNIWKEDGAVYPSRLQILRNYSKAIVKAGGQILFERHNAEHGYYSFTNSEQKTVWVQVKPDSQGKHYTLIIIEEEPMVQEINIDAQLIKNKIDIDGKIAIYGILFDIGKAEVKAESQAAFEQIGKYLKENPAVNCWIVGHTDSDGSFEVNSKLSLDRAQAVKQELEQKHGISSARLFAEGVGPLAPVASNASEAGKRLNRRVEFVKK